MTIDPQSWSSAKTATWVLFGAAIIAVYLFALDLPLLGPDEPRYAQVAREMFERGDWVTPTLGGYNWFEKPALLYWLQIASYSIFGVSEFAARFGSALFGLGTVASLWLLGRNVQSSKFKVQSFSAEVESSEFRVESSEFRVQNSEREYRSGTDDSSLEPESSKFEHGTRNPEHRTRNTEPSVPRTQYSVLSTPFPVLANYFALITATSLGLIAFSRGASFDIIITFPVTASLVGFYIYDKCSDASAVSRYLSLAAFYFFIGIGLIAKGLVGAVFPFAIVGIYFLLSRRWPERKLVLSLFWGVPLLILVAGTWYLPMILSHGWEFIDEFFIQHHFQRYTSNKYSHPGPIWYFFAVLPAMTIPWLPFFLVAIWKYIRRRIFERKRTPPDDFVSTYPELLRFATAWLLVPLVFFSVSGSKLPGYILPALPPALIFAGLYIREFAAGSWLRDAVIKLNAFAMLLAVTLILFVALPRFARSDSVKPMIETADAQGFANSRILNMHTISHNLEFYGAGRLVRERNGKQWRFLGVPGVVEYMSENSGKTVLVLIPHNFERELTSSRMVNTRVLDRNEELSLVSVRLVE